MTLTLLCSGQGHQHPGMFGLSGGAPAAAPLFQRATTLLGYDPRLALATRAPQALQRNREAQILCTLQALSAAAAIADSLPPSACIAGYSVGEIAAWSLAGWIDPLAALDLAADRAEIMDAASDEAAAMLALRARPRSSVEALCAEVGAAIAIVNPDDAYVLAAPRSRLPALTAGARQRGALHLRPIAVEVASHTPFLSAAVAPFRQRLERLPLARRPARRARLFSGIDGAAVFDAAGGLDKLARQIAEPLQWAACLEACVEAGSQVFLELGPGRALAAMAAARYPQLEARSLDDFKTVAGACSWLARHTRE